MHSILAELDLATLRTYRSEAIVALHELSIGRTTVSIAFEGRQRQFNSTNFAALRRWLNDVQDAIRFKEDGRPAGLRPIYPGYGYR